MNPTSSAPPATPPGARATHRRFTLIALLLSTAMSSLEATVVTTAMPTVVGELGGLANYAWVFTGYLLASTVPLPLLGKLSDVHGRKPLLLIGIGFFTVGSLAAGLATSMEQLIAFRILQGLGGGAMQTIGITVTGDLYSLRERGRIQGLFSGVWGIAAVIGPVIGGWIAHVSSWRWIFLFNVPIGIATFVLLALVFHENRAKEKRPPVDAAGAVVLSAGILFLLGGAQRTIPLGLSLGAAATLIAAFIAIERRAVDPLIPLALFRRPVVALSVLINALLGGVLFSVLSYVPLYAQTVMELSPTEAGLLLTPLLAAWPIASTVTGRLIERLGFRLPIRVGLVLCALGGVWTAASLASEQVVGVRVGLVLVGLGQGFVSTSLLLALQNSVAWRERGVVTALYIFARTTGGTITAGAFGGVVAAALARVPGVSPDAADALLGPEHGRGLAPELLAGLGSALREALVFDFWMMGALCALAAVIGWLLPRIQLRAETTTAIEAPHG